MINKEFVDYIKSNNDKPAKNRKIKEFFKYFFINVFIMLIVLGVTRGIAVSIEDGMSWGAAFTLVIFLHLLIPVYVIIISAVYLKIMTRKIERGNRRRVNMLYLLGLVVAGGLVFAGVQLFDGIRSDMRRTAYRDQNRYAERVLGKVMEERDSKYCEILFEDKDNEMTHEEDKTLDCKNIFI